MLNELYDKVKEIFVAVKSLNGTNNLYSIIIDKHGKNMISRSWFRSTDLWVMGPARFHCANLLTVEQYMNDHRCIYLSIYPFPSSIATDRKKTEINTIYNNDQSSFFIIKGNSVKQRGKQKQIKQNGYQCLRRELNSRPLVY